MINGLVCLVQLRIFQILHFSEHQANNNCRPSAFVQTYKPIPSKSSSRVMDVMVFSFMGT